MEILKIRNESEVVDLIEYSDIVEPCCKYDLKVKYPGRLIEEDVESEEGYKVIWYDENEDKTIFNNEMVFGSPNDDYVDSYVWSTETEFAKQVMGKPLGKQYYITTQGVSVEVEFRGCKVV